MPHGLHHNPCHEPAPPAPPAARRDGWTPERRTAFLDALAASGCVAEACATVGMSRASAYALRVKPEAQQFRMAWDAALDLGIRALADACFARAINGVPIPHFYQGEQVGEHRRYDDRLAMFLLRYRDPLRYAASLDQMVYTGHPEGAGVRFAHARNAVLDEAAAMPDGEQLPPAPPYAAEPIATVAARPAELPVDEDWAEHDPLRRARADRVARERAEEEAARGRVDALFARLAVVLDEADAAATAASAGEAPAGRPPVERRPGGDVVSTSSTSPPPDAAPDAPQRALPPSQATTLSGAVSP
ncbi:hypothetical protein [Sphingomonas sp.]|uniref:hypothetical protein n=1 Tax=Sphingomonas sp. TaxID=28214 RepID=UPI003AFFF249